MSVALKVLLVHPGASWSTADVYEGLKLGLETHGVTVIPYRLDWRIEAAQIGLTSLWKTKQRHDPETERAKPTKADVLLSAGLQALTMALHYQVDLVLIVSGMFLHPEVVVQMKRAGLIVTLLLTESPYDLEDEAKLMALVDGGWTMERTAVAPLRKVNPHVGYLPHAWHPLHHTPSRTDDPPDVPAHDVVFVGSGFPDRVSFFNTIDWTGIDLGLYGVWKKLGLKKALRPCIKGDMVPNTYAAALYKRAKIGLNLYRQYGGWGPHSKPVSGESLNPRAYELAACGAFHLSAYRAEVPQIFGSDVPTFTTPQDAERLIRRWLQSEAERDTHAMALPARVAMADWITRSRTVLGDVRQFFVPASHAERRVSYG